MIGRIGRMFGFGVPAMGPQAGFGAGYNINAGQMPFTGQGRGLGEMSQEDLDEEMRRIRELQAMQQSQIQAPKDRGMFGRFAGFNPFRFDPDKGVGEGNRLYAIGAGLAGMGTGDPGLTAELLEPRLKANRERVAAKDKAEQERQRLEMFAAQFEDPRQQAAILAGFGGDEAGKSLFAPPAPQKPLEFDGLFLDPDDPSKILADYRQKPEPETASPNSVIGKIAADLRAGFITQDQADAAIAKANAQSGGMTFSLDENGNPVVSFGGPGVPSAFGSRGQAVGANVYSKALDEAATTDNTLALFNTAESILDRGYNSGYFANLRGTAGAIAGDLGFSIPGLSKPENIADYEEFNAINKQLAAQMLTLFGGSDTERELAISIISNIGPSMSEETNRRMIATGKQMIERQRAKPDHIANWVRRFGSMDAIDPETGLSYQATWDRTLQQLVSNAAGAASERRQSVIEQAVGGPPPGIIRNGYRFKGGDPNDRNNWEPVQ